jgi:hypothetical protein
MGNCGAGLALLFAVVCSAPDAASAQDAPAPARRGRPVARPGFLDSSDALGRARAAQRDFENLRRRFLPHVYYTGSGCQERVGRICWFDDDDDTASVPSVPPPEPPRIVAGRERFLARLDTLASAIPGDDWIIGQQVRYLIEAGQVDEAVNLARDCAPRRWWCDAVGGLALHTARHFAAADSAFASALAGMPEAERCEWIDLTRVLEGDLLEAYRPLSCAERLTFNDRLWWLTDPLHARPGNDRRTEHYSRVTLDRAQHRAVSVHRLTWGEDLGELTVRYGWPSHYAQHMPGMNASSPPTTLAYHRTPVYQFFPMVEGMDLWTADESAWALHRRRAPEHYSPTYATFGALDEQTAAFPRGDSVLVATAYDAGADTLFGDAPLEAALVLTRGPDSPESVTSLIGGASRRGTLTATLADGPLLASVEIIGKDRVRRARVGVPSRPKTTAGIRLSDLAYFTPAGDSLPDSFAAFLPTMRTTTTARQGERLGLYWELSGLAGTDARLVTRIDVVREGRHWLRRAGERIGILSPDRGVRLGWQEAFRDANGTVPRSVVVDLTTLEAGTYRIEVTVGAPGETPMIASRGLRIVR